MYTNSEGTSHPQVDLNGLKLNEAAVETEFVITVPLFGYYSAVLEGTSGILSLILLAWNLPAQVHGEHPCFRAFRCIRGGE